jgi:uncharacterized protein YbcI
MDTDKSSVRTSGNVRLDISNAIVAIQKELYGRGPTKAQTHIGDDLVVVVLQGGYSRAENTLVAAGRDDAVNESRLAMQDTLEEPSVTVVQRLTGRAVRSFMSANDPEQEYQVEVFVLEPESGPAPPEPPGGASAGS